MPLIIGAGVAGHANLPVVLLGMSAVFGFLARPPAELAIRRGADRIVNGGWAIMLGGAAVGAAIALLAYYERWWLLPLGIALVAGPLAVVSYRALRVRWRDLGELLIVASFSLLAPAAHYAAAGDLEPTGFSLWLLSALYGGSSVVYVRMLLSERGPSKDSAGPDRRLPVLIYHATLVALVLLIVLVGNVPLLVLAAFAPLLAKVIFRMARPPDHLDVRKTGLFEASQVALFAVLLVAAYAIS